MKHAIFTILVLLVPAQLFAAASTGNREFTINRPFKELTEALTDPETLKEMLKQTDVRVLELTLEEVDLEGGFDLQEPRETLKWSGKAKVSGRVILQTQRGTVDMTLRGVLYRAKERLYVTLYSVRASGPVKSASITLNVWKRAEKQTAVHVKMHLGVRVPCFRCRLIQRIANRKASQIVCGIVRQGLWAFECKTRAIVERYHKNKPKEPVRKPFGFREPQWVR